MKLKRVMMTLATLVVAMSAMFNAVETAHAAKPIKKYVKLRLGEPTSIAGVTLQPGDYTVKIVQSADGVSKATLEFSHNLDTPYTEQELSLYEEEVVLTIEASLQDLSNPARKTELVRSATDRVSGLEVRGKSTEYVFDRTADTQADGQ